MPQFPESNLSKENKILTNLKTKIEITGKGKTEIHLLDTTHFVILLTISFFK